MTTETYESAVNSSFKMMFWQT